MPTRRVYRKIQNARRDITRSVYNESTTRDLIASGYSRRRLLKSHFMSMITQLCRLSLALVLRFQPRSLYRAGDTGLQADCCCIIMQIASLVNTKNVRTTPPADNQPLFYVGSLADSTTVTSPHSSRFGSRSDNGMLHLRNRCNDATRSSEYLVAPDASSRRVLSAILYVTMCTASVSCDAKATSMYPSISVAKKRKIKYLSSIYNRSTHR